jgi:hypothetical protein
LLIVGRLEPTCALTVQRRGSYWPVAQESGWEHPANGFVCDRQHGRVVAHGTALISSSGLKLILRIAKG